MSAAAIRRKWAGKEERRSTGCTYLILPQYTLIELRKIAAREFSSHQAYSPTRARRQARARPETAPKARSSTKAVDLIFTMADGRQAGRLD